jgi:3-oxoacyl-[acyl-carrier protein] reductase
LRATGDRLPGSSERVQFHAGDIASDAACQELVDLALRSFSRLDILVNNAGDYTKAPIESLDDAAWQRMFDVNLKSTMLMMRAAARVMAKQGKGWIVNISSIDAFLPKPTLPHYAAAKAGVISLTRSFAAHYGPCGVLINAVAPGPVATERAISEGWLDQYIPHTPLRRCARPEDIADVVCFLAGDENRCITGETVVASCGLLMA